MLAKEYDPSKHDIGGYYWSEKLDGIRAFWDGGISQGLPKASIPWANTNKDARYREEQYATGLWSRYGNVIHAPDWWLNRLPRVPLDGELWTGRSQGDRQRCKSITSKIEPSDEWCDITYHVFGTPPPESIFEDGLINNPNFEKQLQGCMKFVRIKNLEWCAARATIFQSAQKMLQSFIGEKEETVVVLPQNQLPRNLDEAKRIIEDATQKITAEGGEGIMLMAPYGLWVPERVGYLLKVKQAVDAEAIVVGYTAGEETDKGSKLRGLMGALLVDWNGKRFRISGFTDQERMMNDPDYCWDHPGEVVPENIRALEFPRGSKITFKYRGLTRDGLPCEARYWRKP